LDEHGGEVPNLKFANGDPATLDDYMQLVGAYLRQTLTTLIDKAAKGQQCRWGTGTT
jgi:hypothetical protein